MPCLISEGSGPLGGRVRGAWRWPRGTLVPLFGVPARGERRGKVHTVRRQLSPCGLRSCEPLARTRIRCPRLGGNWRGSRAFGRPLLGERVRGGRADKWVGWWAGRCEMGGGIIFTTTLDLRMVALMFVAILLFTLVSAHCYRS
eukprot:COSAG02_NODE_2675_length_8272_cov_3.246391_4_plen_144_part_00